MTKMFILSLILSQTVFNERSRRITKIYWADLNDNTDCETDLWNNLNLFVAVRMEDFLVDKKWWMIVTNLDTFLGRDAVSGFVYARPLLYGT